MPRFFIAEVMSNNDTGKEGRVQFKIDHLMDGFGKGTGQLTDDYPWARPVNGTMGGSKDFGISCIPEIGTKIWIFYEDEKNWRNPFYFGDLNLTGMNHHNNFGQQVNGINVKEVVSSDAEYPDVKYMYFKNGVCLSVATGTDAEITLFHPKKTWLHIDKEGALTLHDTYHNVIKTGSTGIDFNSNALKIKITP